MYVPASLSPALPDRRSGAYYAAQLGISLKAQDVNSRNLLLNLLDALERLKKELGPNDTIDIEPASAAYVENFALKVFRMADDEDRAGNTSRYLFVLRHVTQCLIRSLSTGQPRRSSWQLPTSSKSFESFQRPTSRNP